MVSHTKDKKVLFVTTKNLDYIRNTQELKIISENALSYTIIGSSQKSYLKRLVWVYLKLLSVRTSDYDVVFIGFAPQLVLPIFWYKFKKVFIIEDFFISMHDTLCCDRRKFKPDGLIGKFIHWIDEFTLKQSDLVICDTNAHGDYFANEFHIDRSRIQTLYLEADTNIYHPMAVSKQGKYKGQYIVCYFGSILPLQGIDVILEAFRLLQGKDKIKLICIGPVREKLKSDNIEYIDWLTQQKLADYIALSDLCLAGHFNKNIEKAKRTIPGKAFIYQAMEKPMIVGDNPANHELFTENEKVTFVEMGNPKALSSAIITRFEQYEEARRIS